MQTAKARFIEILKYVKTLQKIKDAYPRDMPHGGIPHYDEEYNGRCITIDKIACVYGVMCAIKPF